MEANSEPIDYVLIKDMPKILFGVFVSQPDMIRN
jgi:hypothetical protein